MLDYLLSTLAVMLFAWKGWGWSPVRWRICRNREFTELYAPMEEALVAAGMVNGVAGLLAATALLGIGYPLIEGLTGASPGEMGVGTAYWSTPMDMGKRGLVHDAFCRQVHPPGLGGIGRP